MTPTVPAIYTPVVQPLKLPATGRLLALALAGAALAVLIVAVTIPPAPAGVGTHLGLGFQPCQFLAASRIPCMSCGMTTAFAHFVRGNWIASFYVQPMGFVLALGAGTIFWGGLYSATTGRPIQRLLRQVPPLWGVVAFMGFAIAAWGWKIFAHLGGIGGF